MPYPGPKVHRVSRRKLGKGQYPAVAGLTCDITGSASTATLTFPVPVVVSGDIPVTYGGGRTLVSQTIVSSTVVTQLLSGTVTTQTYDLPANAANVATFQGGKTVGESGTFS